MIVSTSLLVFSWEMSCWSVTYGQLWAEGGVVLLGTSSCKPARSGLRLNTRTTQLALDPSSFRAGWVWAQHSLCLSDRNLVVVFTQSQDGLEVTVTLMWTSSVQIRHAQQRNSENHNAVLLREHLRNHTHMQISRSGGFVAAGVLRRLQRILDVQCGQIVTHANVLTESIRIHTDMNEAALWRLLGLIIYLR